MNTSIKSLLLVSLFFVRSVVFGQSSDSITFVEKDWQITPVERGVVWKKGHFHNLFESEQEINLVEIDLRTYRKKIRVAADAKELKPTSQFASENNAMVAINGGFFDVKNGGAVDYVKVKNQVVNRTREESSRANAILLISKKRVEILPDSAVDFEMHKAPDILLSGPLLVQDRVEVPLLNNPFNDNRHPRTALVITSDRKLIFIVVDGRNRMSEGMRLTELSKVLRWLGAEDAMNLDGGGSSTLYVKGATRNSVVNHPSDNKIFDHEGERAVANIVYLKE